MQKISMVPGCSSDDFLTANQIGGFFSRLASKKTLPDEEAEIEVMETAKYEADIDTMISQVVGRSHTKAPDCV